MKLKVFLFFGFVALLFSAYHIHTVVIFDFNSKSDLRKWKIVNDDVMGGRSKSTIDIDSYGNAVFSGKVSTENYGGFASVRYTFGAINRGNSEFVRIRLKGDGKNYQFRLKSAANDYFAYAKTFSTTNAWETIDIRLADLEPTFRGRILDKPNFNKQALEEISFLIANKRNESFKLIIDKIELY